MTAKANHSTPTTIGPAPLVLFGIDSRGKPKAARFSKEHAGLAIKAASQLAAQVWPAATPSSPRLLHACRWAACMRPAEPSCHSFTATSTTCCLPRPQTGPPPPITRRTGRRRIRINAKWVGASLAERLARDRRRRSGRCAG